MYTTYLWCSQKPEEDIGSPGSGLIGGCEPPCVGGFGPLEEQEVLFTAELIFIPAPKLHAFSCILICLC